MSERHAWIVLGALAGILVGAVVPAAAAALLTVAPIGAVTVGLAMLWRAQRWPVWWLLAGTVLATSLVGVTEAYVAYGQATSAVWSAAAGSGLAAAGPLAWVRWAGAVTPFAVSVGSALAVPLLVRRSSVTRAASALRPRWGEDEESDQDRHLRSVS